MIVVVVESIPTPCIRSIARYNRGTLLAEATFCAGVLGGQGQKGGKPR